MARFFVSFVLLIFGAFVAGCSSSVSVQDSAEAFQVSFASTLLSFREDQGPITVPVKLTQVASETIRVHWRVNSSDSSGRCVSSGGVLTFSPGDQVVPLPLCTPTNNETYQGTTTLELELTEISHGTITDPRVMTVRLTDDEPAPFFSFTSGSTSRAESNITPFQLTVELANVQGQQVIVPLQIGGTAQLGVDYTISPNPPNLVFASGETSKQVTITILNEAGNGFSDEEPDETIVLTIPQTQDVEPGDIPVHTVTITDDDFPLVSIANVTGSEGTAAPFLASLNRLSTRDVSFNYTTLDGTAAEGVEYTGVSGVATIPAGSINTSLDVPLRRSDEPGFVGKTLSIQLSAFSNASNTSAISATGTLDRSDLFVPFVTTALTDASTPIGTLAPVRPLAGVAPTFTRAESALVRDHDGVLSWAHAGEARFRGLRRVENLASRSREFTHADWTTGTGVTLTGAQPGDPEGLAFATSLEYDASGAAQDPFVHRQFSSGEALNSYVFSIHLKSAAPLDLGLFIGTTTASINLPGDDTWRRYSVSTTLSAAGSFEYGLIEDGGNAAIAGGDGLFIHGAQLENVTLRKFEGSVADPFLPPSEYVSTDVSSAPVFHGAGVDGVRYLAYANGNSVDGNHVVTESKGSAFADPPGLLMEGASTNLLPESADLNSLPWSQGGDIVVVANSALAPNGALQAETLEDLGPGFATLCQSFSIPNDDQIYTLSLFVKKNESATSSFGMNMSFLGGTTITSADVQLNLTDGTTTGSGHGYVESFGDWYRLMLTHANNTFGNQQISLCVFPAFAANGQTQVQPSAGGTAIVWGAQLEKLPFATSYIPTGATAASRSADSLAYDPPSGFAVNAPYAVSARAQLMGVVPNAANCATSNNCQVLIASNSSHAPYLRVAAGTATSSASFGASTALTALSSLATSLLDKLSAKFYVGSLSASPTLYVGDQAGSATSAGAFPAAPALLYVGGNGAGNSLFGTIRYFEVWNRALSGGEARNVKGY